MEMEKREEKGWLENINNIKDKIVDFKIHLRKVYEAVYSRLRQNQEISTDVGYVLRQLSCQDSWIDDMDRDIKELMGKVDIIAKDVQKTVNMTQCSHCQETIANVVQPMEELPVSKPILGMEGKKNK